MDDLLPVFQQVNRAQCFLHILNLVAKSLLKQFDMKKVPPDDDELTEEEQELLDLEKDLEEEELTMIEVDDSDDSPEDDDMEGWIDEMQVLMKEEQQNLHKMVIPV